MTLVIILLITLLVTAFFYLKCNVLSALLTLMLVILSSFITLTFYEVLADLLVSRGYGAQWPQSGCYLLLFVLSFAILRALGDLLLGGVKIDLGDPIKISTTVVCGLVSGVLICGNLLIALGLSPVQHKMLYSRYNPDQAVSQKTLNNVKKGAFLNPDGLVAGLYGIASKGSLSSSKSFATLHANFPDQIHLNRLKAKDGILTITSPETLDLPSGRNKNPVRTREIEDVGTVTVVRMGIMAKDIQNGGAGSQFKFTPSQIRMVCKSTSELSASTKKNKLTAGAGEAIYPIGVMNGGAFTELDLNQSLPSEEMKVTKNKPLWLDMVFEVPQDSQGVLLQFKQNAVIELPAAVASTDEIEDILDGKITLDDQEDSAEN
ncbi:MAG: hypothetical protein ACYTER_01260 [Planctomycetota bacterium]|jgi:hypothetical protein